MFELPPLEEGAGLAFREIPPRQADAGDDAPVLILLHGVGSNEQDLLGLASTIDPRIRILSVRGPLTIGHGAYAWFSVQFTPNGPIIVPEQEAASREALSNFIAWVCRRHSVPPSRIFLLGFSQGGIMTLNLALTKPGEFGGGLAYNIRLLPEVYRQVTPGPHMGKTPLFIAQTLQDPIMRLAWSRDMKDKLAKLPLQVTYREYEGGHQLTPEAVREGMQWLSNQLATPRVQ